MSEHDGRLGILHKSDRGEQIKNQFMCSGVGSRTEDSKHVLFADMDSMDEETALRRVVEMVGQYTLSDCYLFCSSVGNYHCMCLDKLKHEELFPILKKYAHKQWVKYRSLSNDYVLRLSPKGRKQSPVLVTIVESPYREREMSNAHRMLLNRRYGIKIRKSPHFDNLTKVRVHAYRTRMVKE